MRFFIKTDENNTIIDITNYPIQGYSVVYVIAGPLPPEINNGKCALLHNQIVVQTEENFIYIPVLLEEVN